MRINEKGRDILYDRLKHDIPQALSPPSTICDKVGYNNCNKVATKVLHDYFSIVDSGCNKTLPIKEDQGQEIAVTHPFSLFLVKKPSAFTRRFSYL